ncbi:scoloptoxin SSD552-like [Diabrotica undecimpunctata]|uniref:scoloptoxin SSD552-like n=1 Tax=Diabrotica undecimpunctata TaxID=50387 RepID=UPI003B63FEA1
MSIAVMNFIVSILSIFFGSLFIAYCRADDQCNVIWPPCNDIENIVCRNGGSCDPVPDSQCKPLKNDDTFRKWILEVHNSYRNDIASGKDTRNGATSAANMQVINYDFDLEYTASCTANTCTGEADDCGRTLNFWQNGQSIEIVDGGDEALVDIPHQWYQRIELMDPKDFDNFREDLPLTFTQMIWANSTHVGCAKAHSITQNRSILVCNYGPPGNIYGEKVFERGESTSNCPVGSTRSIYYDSLCGTVIPLEIIRPRSAESNVSKCIQHSFMTIICAQLLYLIC